MPEAVPSLSTVRFSLQYEPAKSHLDAIIARAEFALEQKLITALPVITAGPSAIGGFRSVVLAVPASDRAFWIGFTTGIDYCRNNRAITVGSERGGPRGH